MLNLFNSFQVPGVDHVTVYHDDERDDVFYMLPTKPRFAMAQDGGPLVNVLAFARDLSLMADTATKLPAGETEGGMISMSVDLAVPKEDQDRIRDHIQNDLFSGGTRLITRFAVAERGLRFAQIARPQKIELRYPMWVDGKVKLSMFPAGGEFFVKAVEGSESPSLVGENIATWTVLLGQMGVRLLRESTRLALSPGCVYYDLTYAARFPNLEVKVHGDRKDIYEEIRERCTVTERYGSSTWTYPQISSLQELSTSITSLRIETNVNDIKAGLPGDAAAGDAVKRLENIALDLVQQIITNEFLQPGFEPGLKMEQLGTDPFAHDPNKKAGDPPRAGNPLWLKDFKQEMTGTLDVTIDSKRTSTFKAYPSALLFEMVTPEQLDARTAEADLNTPRFNILDAPIRVTADFANDPIAGIDVTCHYSQTDDGTQQAKSKRETFNFTTGSEVFYFRTTLAKDAQGRPKEEWTYQSTVHYKAAAQALTLPATTTTDRSLTVGYDRLNCVEVQVAIGAVDWAFVDKVHLHLHHPHSDDPNATYDMFFTPDATVGSWFAHIDTGDRSYEYQYTYHLHDGQKLEQPVQRTDAARLVVNAPFDDRIEVAFIPQGVFPPIASIALSVRYSDAAHSYHVEDQHIFLTAGEVWNWSVPLQDPAQRAFEFKVDITYADGSASQGAWAPGTEGTMLVGEVADKVLQVEVVPSLIDATKWKLVIVRLRKDGKEKNFQFTAENTGATQLWKVPLDKGSDRSYTYEINAFPLAAGGEKKTVGPAESTDALLVVEV
ncbi:MAG: hypothetical protein Q7V88_15455 [Actinomycetota bacterium]|nr:hypothetical protein [Actinomycetota bacterium]